MSRSWLLFWLIGGVYGTIGIGQSGPPAPGSNTLQPSKPYLESNQNPYMTSTIPFTPPAQPSNSTQTWRLRINVSEPLDTSLLGTEQAETNTVLSFLASDGGDVGEQKGCVVVIADLLSTGLQGTADCRELGECGEKLRAALGREGSCEAIAGAVASICPERWKNAVGFCKL